MDLISIIITTYNRPQWLDQAINSAVAQTYRPIEVIVVDDGSDKADAKIIAEKYPQVKYIYQKNQGLGAARNLGIASSKGKWIQFLDDDDWLTSDSVFQKRNMVKENSNIDIVYSDLYLCSEDGKIKKGYYQNLSTPPPTGDIFSKIIKYNFIPVHALLWRRSILEKIGGFPERSGHEDWECLIKAAMFAKFEYINNPLGFYRQHHLSMARNFDIMYSGKLKFQKDLVGSDSFNNLANSDRVYLLCKYSFQQWGFGQENLAREFLEEAKIINETSLLPSLLRMWMRTGRLTTRYVIRILGYIKNICDLVFM